ncbi:MAG: hypothetical protein PHY45_16780 [Rhodocyclaceae bacterium]|nr:hypothetical protein [Rhodocyclaceae bacterium]
MIIEPPRCQLHNPLSRPTVWRWLQQFAAALRTRIRLRTRWRRLRSGPPPPAARLGAPSRFAAGSWVRVREAKDVFATLNARKQLRGLLWIWQQWPYCGTVHRVLKPVRRMMDDSRQVRAVSGTVLLATAPCGGPLDIHGCGRECPLMFRDDWLEEASPPDAADAAPGAGGIQATVRSAEEIRRTLDAHGSRGGLMFMPEMYQHAGKDFRVLRKVDRVLESGRYVPAAQPIYMLADLYCGGAALGDDGPCDRSCRLLWHADWLRLPGQGRAPQPWAPAGTRP